jgi:ubiquinone/menaquinone biosynthesis C-methylase UbiE
MPNPLFCHGLPMLLQKGTMKRQAILGTCSTFLLAAVLVLPGAAQRNEAAADVARLIEILQARPGSVLADIGAGPEGPLTIPFARHVDPSGKVYATELGSSLRRLRAAVQNAGLQNVEILEGHPSRTNLPAACCDGIFIRFVYHHFADPASMNASLYQSLKPGGTLAVIEFAPRGSEAPPGDRAGGQTHGVGAEAIARELQQAGFELITSDQGPNREVLVVVRKPT